MRFNILILLLFYSLFTNAANLVCGQDLDLDGVLTGEETSICSVIDGEQFCSIGAQDCNANNSTQYQCSTNNQKYDSNSSCVNNCSTQESGTTSNICLRYNYGCSAITVDGSYVGRKSDGANDSLTKASWLSLANQLGYSDYRINSLNNQWHTSCSATCGGDYGGYANVYFFNNNPSTCTPTPQTTYTCPTAGNSCVDNNGTQQCSPNTCIDLDTTPAIDTTAPALSELDDGNRDATGACAEQTKMFSGRNLSCKKSGFSQDCCKDTGKVLSDSTGSHLSNAITGAVVNETIATTYQVAQGAYASYIAQYTYLTGASGGGLSAVAAGAEAATYAADGAQIAISIVVEFISCGQQDTEAAILNGSGYCHEVGTYCSKEWPAVGCIVKSKSYCCFNSKLARIMQQQGRSQLGISWGNADSPNCAGLTPEQFQSLDFSRIDMSEYYQDLVGQSESLIQQNVNDKVQQHMQQIEGGNL